MTDIPAWFGPVLSVAGAISSAIFALLALRLTKQAQRSEAHGAVGALYDKVLDFRVSHPEMLRLSRQWSARHFERIYLQRSDEDRQWALYYTYVELCLGFCNAVIYLSRRGSLEAAAYDQQYSRLVRLLLTEHNPLVEDLLEKPHFVSGYIRSFRDRLAQEGWDWRAEHQRLALPGG